MKSQTTVNGAILHPLHLKAKLKIGQNFTGLSQDFIFHEEAVLVATHPDCRVLEEDYCRDGPVVQADH